MTYFSNQYFVCFRLPIDSVNGKWSLIEATVKLLCTSFFRDKSNFKIHVYRFKTVPSFFVSRCSTISKPTFETPTSNIVKEFTLSGRNIIPSLDTSVWRHIFRIVFLISIGLLMLYDLKIYCAP